MVRRNNRLNKFFKELTMASTNQKGFAAMDPKDQRRIASKGGKSAHASGHAHEWNAEGRWGRAESSDEFKSDDDGEDEPSTRRRSSSSEGPASRQ
jgi:hypothetical protein